MTDIHTVILDIDGTLINDSKQVTSFTRQELLRIQRDYNAEIILASARMPRSIRTVFEQLDFETHFVAYSGAYSEINGRGVNLAEIPKSILFEYLEPAWRREGLHLGLFVDDLWFVNEVNYWTLREVRGCGVWPSLLELPSLESALQEGSVRKIMLRGDSSALDHYTDFDLPTSNEWVKFNRSSTQLEIYPHECSKSIALRHVLSAIGSSFDNSIAFGDGETDLDMLDSAKIGIAMSNGIEALKSAADEVTLSNNEDGVGLMLRKYFPDSSDRVHIVD